ncbi:hypothetical protein NL676_014383 [Syzygium grande]|nr:hypothetical protein NL676_014383 [Syzygium grande]
MVTRTNPPPKLFPIAWSFPCFVTGQQEGHKRALPRDYNLYATSLRLPSMRGYVQRPYHGLSSPLTMQQGMEPLPQLDAQPAASDHSAFVSGSLSVFSSDSDLAEDGASILKVAGEQHSPPQSPLYKISSSSHWSSW